jgi:uncharacterized protein (TIGR00730 family)
MAQSKNLAYSTGNDELDREIIQLVESWGIEGDITDYVEMIVSTFKFSQQNPSRGDMRLYNRALKELRYAHRVFAPYQGVRKITVFGSARTKPETATYKAAREFAALMEKSGFMIITGAGDGIMGAAQEGAGKEKSFGLNIRLPFEQQANPIIHGDPKLITFRYFFTRKLNFVKESSGIAMFPGGFGTMDECFETLTLLQTGKKQIIPMVFVDAKGGNFWRTFERYLKEHLLRDGMIGEHDFHLFKITDDVTEARDEIVNFYYNFHSYRFVKDVLVLRLQRPVPDGALKRIQQDFDDILAPGGELNICPMLPEEANEPQLAKLPRLCLHFDNRSFGRLRQLIDRVNAF